MNIDHESTRRYICRRHHCQGRRRTRRRGIRSEACLGEHAFAGEYESRGIRPSGIRLEADVVERIDQLEVLRQTRLSLIDRGERVIVHCGRTIVVVVELDEADRDSNQV